MDKFKFLTALKILWKLNKEKGVNDFNSGYATALHDVLQASDLCEKESITNS